jgi:hypothetical protein
MVGFEFLVGEEHQHFAPEQDMTPTAKLQQTGAASAGLPARSFDSIRR